MSLLRFLLFPFTIPYGIAVLIRDFIFSSGIILPKDTSIPTISIGNLSAGGTGKTPFTETCIRILDDLFTIAIISRGYGRKTLGFQWVERDSPSWQVGDEMLQLKRKFPYLTMAVCESRIEAARIIEKENLANLIILDDAYQHRQIDRIVNIMLTTYQKPYYKDFLLPMGNLREFRYAKVRADIIVVTKCPPGTTRKSLAKMMRRFRTVTRQLVLHAISTYDDARELFTDKVSDLSPYKRVLLVTGIASNRELKKHILEMGVELEVMSFRDHARYSERRVDKILEKWHALNQISPTCIITTPKDAVKLREHEEDLQNIPIHYIDYSLELEDVHAFKRYVLPRVFD